MARAIPISMKVFATFFPSLILKLGSMLGDEAPGMRREVLIALRHLMLTPDVRPHISSRLEEFLGNEKLFGCGITLGSLRPIAITTQADFIVQFRSDIPINTILEDIIPKFSSLLETSESRRLPFTVRTVCVRLLSTLIEHLIIGGSQQSSSASYNPLTIVTLRRREVFWRVFCAICRALRLVEADTGEIENFRVFLRAILTCLKVLIYAFRSITNNSSGLAVSSSNSVLFSVRGISQEEAVWFARLFGDLITALSTVLDRSPKEKKITTETIYSASPISSLSSEMAFFYNAQFSYEDEPMALIGEEKEMVENIVQLFILLEAPLFANVVSSNSSKLYSMIVKQPALLFFLQTLLVGPGGPEASKITLSHLLRWLTRNIFGTNGILATFDLTSATYLQRFIKTTLLALNTYPEELESIWSPHLSEIILSSLRVSSSRTTSEPVHSLLVLRTLFRAIGGGRFELLYKEILPILPTILETLNGLLLSLEGHPLQKSDSTSILLRDLVVELALTIPVRLSVLLPYLSLLMKPLVFSLRSSNIITNSVSQSFSSSPDLLSQGLRTLELCIDNLTQDFLDPILSTVMSELLEALWSHCRPLPYPSQFSHTALRIIGKLSGRNRGYSGELLISDPPLSHSETLEEAFEKRLLEIWSENAVSEHVKLITETFLESSESAHEFSTLFGLKVRLLLSDAEAKPKDRLVVLSQLKKNLIEGSYLSLEEFLSSENHLQRMSFISLLFEARNNSSGFLTLVVFLLRRQRSLYATLSACDIIFALAEEKLDETELDETELDEIFEVLFSALAISQQQATVLICSLQLALERALETLWKYIPGLPNEHVLQMFVRELTSPFERNRSMAQSFLESLGERKVIQIEENEYVIPATPATPGMIPTIKGRVISRLLSPLRLSVIEAEWLSSEKRRSLSSLPVSHQVGIIEAIAFVLKHDASFFEPFQPSLSSLLSECTSFADMDDPSVGALNSASASINSTPQGTPSAAPNSSSQNAITPTATTKPPPSTAAVKLRVSCIRLLTGAMGSSSFLSNVTHLPLRNRIVSIFFKSLYARNAEVVSAAKRGLALVIAMQHKLPKELMQHGLRPVLMNLSDYKRLTVPGLEGLGRLLELLTSYFKAEIGRKLLEHLKQWADLIVAPPTTAPEQSMEVSIIVAILDVFHLLPPTSFVFLSETMKTLCSLEQLIRRTESSPFRRPVLKYLARHPSETIECVMSETEEHVISLFCQMIVTMKEEREVIVTSPEVWKILTHRFFSDAASSYKVEVAAAMLIAATSQPLTEIGLFCAISSFLLLLLSSEQQWMELLRFGEAFSLTLREVVWNASLYILEVNGQEEENFQPLLNALISKLGPMMSNQSLEKMVPLIRDVDILCHILSCGNSEELTWAPRQVILAAWIETLQPSTLPPQPSRRGPKPKKPIDDPPLILITTLEEAKQLFSPSLLHSLARAALRLDSDQLRKVIRKHLIPPISSWCLEKIATRILITPSTSEEEKDCSEALRHLLQGDRYGLIVETLQLSFSSDEIMIGHSIRLLIEASEAIVTIQNLSQQHAFFWISLVKSRMGELGAMDLMRLVSGAIILPSWWWSVTLDAIGALLLAPTSTSNSPPLEELKKVHLVIMECIILTMTVSTSVIGIGNGKKRSRASSTSSLPTSPSVPSPSMGAIGGVAELLIKTILQMAPEEIFCYLECLIQLLKTGGLELMSWNLVDQAFISVSSEESITGIPRSLRQALNALELVGKLVKEGLFTPESILRDHCPSLFPNFFFSGYTMLLPAGASPMLQAAVSLNISSKLDTLILPSARTLFVKDFLETREPPATLPQLIPLLFFLHSSVFNSPQTHAPENSLQSSSLADPPISPTSLIAILSDLARDVLAHPPPAVTPTDLSLALSLLEMIKKRENSDPLSVIRGASILLVLIVIDEHLQRTQLKRQPADVAPLSIDEKGALLGVLTFIANNAALYPLSVAVKMMNCIGIWLKLSFLLLKEKMDLIFVAASCYSKLREGSASSSTSSPFLPCASMRDARQAMVHLLHIVYTGSFQHSEVTFQLQKDFLVLLTDCRFDPDLYEQLLTIICDSIAPRSSLTHLRYVLGVQNWEPISGSYWIHEALAIILRAPNALVSHFNAMSALARIDASWAQQLWQCCFADTLLSLSESELEMVGKDLAFILSRPYHHAYTSFSPAHCLLEGIAHLAHATPDHLRALHMKPALLRYGAKNFGWFGALVSLEGSMEHDVDHWLAMAEIAEAMGETDLAFGARRQMASFPQSILSGSLEQTNYLEAAQAVLESVQGAARGGRLVTQPLTDREEDNGGESDEMVLWQQRWIAAARRLQQWDVLVEVARVDNDIDLSLDASWRLLDWATSKDQAAVRAALELVGDSPTPKRLIYGALLGLHSLTATNPHRRLGDLSRIIEEGFQVTLAQWALLPSPPLGGQVRDNLTLAFQLLVEFQEAIPLFLAAAPGAPPFPSTMVPELRGILGTWRERLPHPDALGMWSDLAAWRQSVFGAINGLFAGAAGEPASDNAQGTASGSMAYRGYHESAWFINRFATVARRQALPDICVQLLNKIYTLPNIEIQDAFWKLSEQASCYLDAARDPLAAPWLAASIPLHGKDVEGERATMTQAMLVAGLEIINSTNLAYFTSSQKADFFSLKGRFLEELQLHNEEANKIHSQAVQLDINHGRAWAAWGDYNRRRFSRELQQSTNHGVLTAAEGAMPGAPETTSTLGVDGTGGPVAFAMHAIHCYLQALMLAASPSPAPPSRAAGRETGSEQQPSSTIPIASDDDESDGGESLRTRLLVSKILSLIGWEPFVLAKTLDPYLSELTLAPFLPHLEEMVQASRGSEPLAVRLTGILQRIARFFPQFLFYVLNASVAAGGELLGVLRSSHPLEVETMALFISALRSNNWDWFRRFALAQLGDLELPGQRLMVAGAIAGGAEGSSLLSRRKGEKLRIISFDLGSQNLPERASLQLQLSDGSLRILSLESTLADAVSNLCTPMFTDPALDSSTDNRIRHSTIDGPTAARLLWLLGGSVSRGRMMRQRSSPLLGFSPSLFPQMASEMISEGYTMVVLAVPGAGAFVLSKVVADDSQEGKGDQDKKRSTNRLYQDGGLAPGQRHTFGMFLSVRLPSAQSFWLARKCFSLQWASLLMAWSILGAVRQRSLDSLAVTSLERCRLNWRGGAFFDQLASKENGDLLRLPLLFRMGPVLQDYFGSVFLDGLVVPGIYAIADALHSKADDTSLLFDLLISGIRPRDQLLSADARGAMQRIQMLACEKEKKIIAEHVSEYVGSICSTSPLSDPMEGKILGKLPASLYAPIVELVSMAALAAEHPDVDAAWHPWF